MEPNKQKALFIRLDRLGDLILTLPSDQLLELRKSYSIDWVIPKGLNFVLEASKEERKYKEWDKDFHWKNFFFYLSQIKQEKYDAVVVFQSHWWVMLLCFIARIPIRVGQKSKLASFIFLNKAIRQKRSNSNKNELEYNVELVQSGLNLKDENTENLFLELISQKIPESLNELTEKNYIVVHPGMGGSALNWPTEKYIALIEKLSAKNIQVIVTGTEIDKKYVDPIIAALEVKPLNLLGQLSGSELIDLLAKALAVIAPSTGVVHIAAATGVPTIGIYPPIQVQSPIRWGAKGKNVKILSPEIKCPEKFHCAGESCPEYFCMSLISVDQILQSLPIKELND